MKFLSVAWFNRVGIVRCEGDLPGDIRYYIKEVEGWSEESDIQEIMDWGSTFPKDVGNKLFGID
jgi:hypothetical protein